MQSIGRRRYGWIAASATVLSLAAAAAMANGASAAPAGTTCDPALDFGSARFSHPTVIDNRFLPLLPGTQLVLDGQANRGGGLVPHRVVFTVTGVTKVIAGVATVVVWDRDISDGQLVEEELALWAQDDDGNVWSLGEHPEELSGGVVTGAPSTWLAGVAGAQAGIHMFGTPRLGSSWYLQGWAPTIDFLDCARTYKTGETTCVPVGCFNDVLITEETSPLDRGTGGKQRKSHAPGIGIVQIAAVGDREGETLALTEYNHLSGRLLAEANARAILLDRRAYELSPDVWGATAPAR